MGYKLYVGGARGSRVVCGQEFLHFGGDTSNYVITDGQYALVVDAGSGLSNLKEILKPCKKIDVVLSHLHYDHLIGFLDFEVFPKGVTPCIYGTFAQWGVEENPTQVFVRKPFWPVPLLRQPLHQIERGIRYPFGLQAPAIANVGEGQAGALPDALPCEAQGGDALYVTLHEANHPDYCSAIVVEVAGQKLLFLCDYEHGKPIPPAMAQCYDIMFYDAMYTPEEYETRKGYGHSTMQEGILLANKLGVKQLVLTHHAPDRTDQDLYAMQTVLQQEIKTGLIAHSNMSFEL